MNLHHSQSAESPVILKIPEGDEVKVLDSSHSDWWEVQYFSRTGYVQSKFLKYSPRNDKPDFATLPNTSGLYDSRPSFTIPSGSELYEHAAKTSAVLTRLPEGLEVKIVDSSNPDWLMVHHKGLTGYIAVKTDGIVISDEFTSKGAGKPASYKLTNETSLRTGPDSQSKVLMRFSVGDEVKVLDDSGRWWWKVSFRGREGWVKRHLLDKN